MLNELVIVSDNFIEICWNLKNKHVQENEMIVWWKLNFVLAEGLSVVIWASWQSDNSERLMAVALKISRKQSVRVWCFSNLENNLVLPFLFLSFPC